MRKAYKIAGGIALGLVLLVAIVVVWATIDMRTNGLPRDSLPIVETGGYRFEAPPNWITACEDRAPGCLAVVTRSPDAPLWTSRTYWIEVQPMDATVPKTLTQRALDAVRPIVEADGGDPSQMVQAYPEPVVFEGVQLMDVVDSTASRFSRSRIVQFPDGNLLRFTCYGEEKRELAEHDGACFAALNQLHFPEAERLAYKRAYDEDTAQRAREAAERAASEKAASQKVGSRSNGAVEPSRYGPLFGSDLGDEAREMERKRDAERAARRSQPGASDRFVAAAREAIEKSRGAIRSGGPVSGFDLAGRTDIRAARAAILAARRLTVDASDDANLDVLASSLSMSDECAQEDLVGSLDVLTPTKPACEPEVLKRQSLEKISRAEQALSTTRRE